MPQAEGLWQLSTQPRGTGGKERKEPRLSPLICSPGLAWVVFKEHPVGDVARDWHFLAGIVLESKAALELEHSNSSHVLGRGAGRIGEFWEAAAFTLAGKSSGSSVYLEPSEKVFFFSPSFLPSPIAFQECVTSWDISLEKLSLLSALSKGIPGRW